MNGKKVFSVSELTKKVKFVLEDGFENVWVEGEVSNFKVYSSGHAYFSLKDSSSVLQCVLFRRSRSSIAMDLEDGMHVALNGRISVYAPRGQYQMIVSNAELRGEGALRIAFEKLKKKLFEEGLFSESAKKDIPGFPQRIAIVTSASGAAVRDILKVLIRRFGALEILIRPALVQGKKAAGDIKKAVEEINEYNRLFLSGEYGGNAIDLIILGRGGGSLEDLWAFNDEGLARAIAASEVPVISAVGHEVDFTISDFVADFRAATPSAAAEAAVPVRRDILAFIETLLRRLHAALLRRLEREQKHLNSLKSRYVLRAPLNFVLQHEQRIDELIRRAESALSYKLQAKKARYERAERALNALSPLGVLKRGYSITFKENNVVASAQKLQEGDKLITRFCKGQAESIVTGTEGG